MSIATIELNDIAIRFDGDQGIIESPGYAVIDGDNLLIGEAGRANARLLPRWRNNRFWQSLDTNPLADGTARVRHHADLVFSHLESLSENVKGQTGVILLVPSDYIAPQLGLLLGITKELGWPVSAMLDTGVAAALNATSTHVMHIEIYQHRWVMTAVTTGDHLQRTHSIAVGNRGWSSLMDQWATLLSDRFIAEHRYDPTHQAASEQALYDHIPVWLGDPNSPPSLDVGEASRTVSLSEAEWKSVCSEQIAELMNTLVGYIERNNLKGPVEVLLGHHAAHVPGIAQSLELIEGVVVTVMKSDSVSTAVRTHGDTIASLSADVTHIVQLPIGVDITPHTQHAPRATHLLCGSRAIRIDNSLDVIGIQNGRLVAGGNNPAFSLIQHGARTLLDPHRSVVLNGTATVDTSDVVPGDVISLDSLDLMIISDA